MCRPTNDKHLNINMEPVASFPYSQEYDAKSDLI